MAQLTEEWKPVVGFNRIYEISSFGNVRRVCPWCGPTHTNTLKNHKSPNGYVVYTLSACKVRKRVFGHVLVAEAFLGERPDGLLVNHKDGDKTNNRLENLEYVTPSQNHIHAVINGLRPAMKLNADTVRQIRSLKGHVSSGKLAEQFGVSKTHIKSIWKRKVWGHLTD